MSRTYFAFALPVVVCAVPALAQGYYPAPPPSYYYERAPAPEPARYPPQGYYQQDPRYAQDPRYSQAPEPRYQPAPQSYYRDDDRQAPPPHAAAEPSVDEAPVQAPALKPAPDRLEQMMWQAAVQANSVDGYATYLNRYPRSEHAREADAAMEQIRRNPPAPRVAAAEPAPEPAPVAAEPIKEAAAVAPAAIKVASVAVAVPVKSTMIAGGKTLPIATVPTAAVPVAPSDAVEGAAPVVAKPIVVASASPISAQPSPSVIPVAASDPAPMMCRPSFAGEAPYEQAGEAEIGAYSAALRANSVAAYEAYLQTYPHGVFAPEVSDLVASRQGRVASMMKATGLSAVAARARTQVMPTERDYPTMALRDGQEGKATASWQVAEDGCVELCKIEKSSGSDALDAASCRAITSRGRYDPALDASGHPVRTTDSATFTWKLPVH